MSLVINMFISPLTLDSQGIALLVICVYVLYASWVQAGELFEVYIIDLFRRSVSIFHMIIDKVMRRCMAVSMAHRAGQGVGRTQFNTPVPRPQNQKPIVGSPFGGGIGIGTPSPYILPYEVEPEFFSLTERLEIFNPMIWKAWLGGEYFIYVYDV